MARRRVPPRLTWWNTTLTDSGHHAGGPRLADRTGRRCVDATGGSGAWLDLVEERGLPDDIVVLLTADHGMQAADPTCTGDWDAALTAAGIPFRDEAPGSSTSARTSSRHPEPAPGVRPGPRP